MADINPASLVPPFDDLMHQIWMHQSIQSKVRNCHTRWKIIGSNLHAINRRYSLDAKIWIEDKKMVKDILYKEQPQENWSGYTSIK